MGNFRTTRRMKGCTKVVLIALTVACIAACSEPVAQRAFTSGEPAAAEVFVIYDSWHSAILIKATDLAPEFLPELRDFPDAAYLEFSWGDREYFPHPDPGLGLALKAAFWSSGSVLHVVAVSGNPAGAYPQAETIKIAMTAGELQRLVQFVSATFVRSGPGSASITQPGLSANARFYPARGRFSILRTCNTWVAEALEAAELPINPAWVITAASLGRNARPLGISQ